MYYKVLTSSELVHVNYFLRFSHVLVPHTCSDNKVQTCWSPELRGTRLHAANRGQGTR